MAEKEKERGKDLVNMSVFCQGMAVELLSITATEYNPATLLKAHDRMGTLLITTKRVSNLTSLIV